MIIYSHEFVSKPSSLVRALIRCGQQLHGPIMRAICPIHMDAVGSVA